MAFLLLPENVLACACNKKPTVLDDYEQSDEVLIARAVSVRVARDKSELPWTSDPILSTTMLVQKVFKGKLRAGDQITFRQGNGIDCLWEFDEREIGEEYLFYLASPTNPSELWYVSGCGRSKRSSQAGDDLRYLNNIDKVRGKTRISGTYKIDDDSDALEVEGRKIRIIGRKKVYETTTDKGGVYELYDLPPGKYVLQPEMPPGWKIARSELGRSPSYSERAAGTSKSQVAFTLRPKKHAGIDFSFQIENVIRGSVYDSKGKVMADVCPTLVPVFDEEQARGDCTSEKGHFRIESAPAGSYLLVLNQHGTKTIREPFPRSYYPNVTDRKNAGVITIAAGQSINGLRIIVPEMEETITVSGIVRYADNKPAAKRNVRFSTEKTRDIDGNVVAYTDAAGRFSMKIFKGVKGELDSGFSASPDEVKRCPMLKKLIKKDTQNYTFLTTPAIKLVAEHDLHNVVLKFPFPSCRQKQQTPDDEN